MKYFFTNHERTAIEQRIDQIRKRCSSLQEEVDELRERLRKKESGEPCEGLHCQGCKNAINVTSTVYVSDVGIRHHDDVICALTVPCKSFNRKED